MKLKALILSLGLIPVIACAQAGGITLNLEDDNPLSKWGRWTYFEGEGGGYAFGLHQNRNKTPLTASFGKGDWVFKLNKDVTSAQHDLFFGLKVREDFIGTTSVGCMSNSDRKGQGNALCGVQLDLNLD